MPKAPLRGRIARMNPRSAPDHSMDEQPSPDGAGQAASPCRNRRAPVACLRGQAMSLEVCAARADVVSHGMEARFELHQVEQHVSRIRRSLPGLPHTSRVKNVALVNLQLDASPR